MRFLGMKLINVTAMMSPQIATLQFSQWSTLMLNNVQRYKRPEFEVKRINNGEKYTCGATKGLSTTKKGTAHGGATKITPHCSKCRSAGHDKRKCPFEGNTKDTSSGTIGKGKKKQVIICCSLCALTGHNDGECMASCSQCGLMGHNEDECLVWPWDLSQLMHDISSISMFIFIWMHIYVNFILGGEVTFM